MVKRSYLFWLIAVAILALDQVTKFLVLRSFSVGENVSFLPFLSFTYVRNTGAGFGILQNNNGLFIVIALIAVGVIFYYLKTVLKEHKMTVCVALILGGAVGNLLDRVLHGFVIDFVDFHFWPAFNVADSALVIGVLGIILWSRKK
ncbi:signal peptidase II [Candidatus Woesearchaeota archaeon]|nr:signal peptidase II [Candidatus Woesearchaeota archaeon]